MHIDESDPQHEEVWDDSLLIDSWNQALQEYKKYQKYHSIHAKGGSIRDLERVEAESSKADEARQVDKSDSLPLTGTLKSHNDLSGKAADEAYNVSAEQHGTQPGHGLSSVPNAFPSQAILGTVRDDNLKKLLMSWYYAGYYTGLFEGQQQAQQQPDRAE
ncbi:hypothetical protein Trco_007396 [Trichoderma cornu-damae]|uniref:Survival Motor Neuron Gemin2-binding domain-containing protein n=1 Tax=Trichoderma cornu-damae TaxID=654480 RepID=A0A9P8QEB8_9HYPO|nr:hypothetical protein Trco_007396 [Trichoderma cornu-damae]